MIDRLISGAGSRRADRVLGYVALALLAYLPPLFTAGGKVAADTKSYLYLDPDRMMSRAASMWDPNIGFGTVTHQNIGYLFPMGPYYSFFERIGAPDWLAQRLWLGTIIFAAGLGVLALARTIGLRGPGVPVAAVAYAISPYSLHYASRISVLLLPWAALGFLIALAIKALREGGWRAPAIFALVVQVVGGVNATALIFAGVAPVAWIVWSWLGLREIDARRALGTSLRIGTLTTVTSLWWIAGLSLQGGYGLNILRFTETVKAVARTSTPNEILRGLGYWFFYGRDRLGAWIESSEHYTQRPEIILVGYGLAALALLAACTVRWRHRGYFAGLLLLGVVFAAGAHPYDSPTPLGSVFKAFATSSTAGLALRSTGRAIPLVTLAEAMFLGVGVNAAVAWLREREARPRVGRAAFVVPVVVPIMVPIMVIGLVFVDFPALRNGTYYGKNLLRPESIPDYWSDAIASFDTPPDAATGAQTRVLELAGSDFASYEWGNTVDPITPGLMDRPYVARELIPYGSPPSADLLNALDRRFQEGVTDDPGLVQLLGRMGIGTVVARNDIQWQRYDLARPRELERMLAAIGLDAAASFGGPLPPETEYPVLDRAPAIDERTLGDPESGIRLPDRVVVYPVDGARPILRTASTDAPVVVAGDGEGLADVAGAGLLDDTGLVFYSATFAGDDGPAALIAATGDDAVLVLTDTNRRRARRWSNVRDNVGYTETAGEEPLVEDLSDARLDVFPDASDDAFTVTEPEGVAQVRASAYGNPISYTPEDRAARALDGDTGTAWKAAAFDRAVGQYLDIELAAPITTDRVNLVQVLSGPRDRVITTARLTFLDADGNEVGERFDTDLSIVSRRKEGQTVVFGERTFARVRIEITGTNLPDGPLYGGYSAVGFGEVRLRDAATGALVTEREVVRLPTDLLATYGDASLEHPLVVLLRRERVAPVPPRYDPELYLLRAFELPTERTFALGGEVRLGPAVTDTSKIDLVQGLARSEGRAMNSAYMAGCVECRAYSAFDDDPATAWQSIFFGIEKAWVQIVTIEPHTYDHLDLQVIADGRHSLPTKLRVLVDDTEVLVDLPPIEERDVPNATVTVPVDFAPLTGTRLRVQVLAAEERTATNFFSGKAVALPVAFAEVGAGVSMGEIPVQFPDECRDDLLRIDGSPVSVRIVGTNADLRAMQPLRLEACDGDVTLGAGRHVIESVRGVDTGIDVDRLVFASAAGGAAATVSGAQVTGGLGAPAAVGPDLVVDESDRTSATVTVRDAEEPFWLVLDQSHNRGWTARVRGGDALGAPVLVEGHANGWLVDPADRGDLVIDLEWTPQRRVSIGIALSLAGGLLCLVLIALAWRRRRRDPRARARADDDPALVGAWSWFAGHAVPLGVRSFGLGALVAGLGSLVIAPYVGVPMGLAVLAALRWPWARAGLRLGAAAAIGLAGLYVAVVQFRNDNPAVFEWPTLTWRARTPGWIAAVLPFVVFLVDRFTGTDDTAAADG